jgi:peptide/nickel transport system substrate-binding protein
LPFLAVSLSAHAAEFRLREAPMLAERVKKGTLPPLNTRLPKSMLIVSPHEGKDLGVYGGEMRTLAVRARDLRYMSANGYTRLVGYNEKLELVPDVVELLESDGVNFTFTLRDGHRWSNGEPFTTEDFRYWWEDVANNKDLAPAGPPDTMMVDGKPPRVTFIDERRVRFSWEKPNPRFLPALAAPRPLQIYAPAAYLKKFHAKYTDRKALDALAAKAKLKSWATLHNRLDDAYEQGNPPNSRPRASSLSVTPIITVSIGAASNFPTSTRLLSISPQLDCSPPKPMLAMSISCRADCPCRMCPC